MDLGALPAIRCRAARIHQVVVNLLTNAIDACAEDGGVVTVKTETEPEAMGVRIDIRDNGCGIPTAIRERIFDPFFTTKPVGQGTGLGLSISYGIVHEHGGRIEVQSSPEQGACFMVHLPVEPGRKLEDEVATLVDGLPVGDEPAHALPYRSKDESPEPLSAAPAASTGELAP
jgi:signal transduction histidine kinase